MISHPKPIIVIAGPTASGKSSLAIKLAKDINGVIINADSRQIYKEISVGTARPTKEQMQGVPHYLYGHVSVKEDYNIYKYQQDVKKVLNEIGEEKTPILVGGSGLYIDSVIFNYKLKSHPDTEETLQRREELNKMGVKKLQNLVKQTNPKLLEELNESDRKNPVRLIRIVEKGRSKVKGQALEHIYFVIDIPKGDSEDLEKRIMQRTEEMFKNGLLEENIKIREKGLDKYSALDTIGYQEFEGYFQKKISLEAVKKEIIKNTKRYAKRQRTWFRKHEHAIWTNNYSLILEESLKVIKT
jgi:tRNA dimethylallyltransferase